MPERTPQERETLVFTSPEKAQEFSEAVRKKGAREKMPDVSWQREAVEQQLAREFEREGEGIDIIRQPWEHSRQEHVEVQRLVDIAFERDLRAAVREARVSDHYPRNLDLFHDVLTGELWEILRDTGTNRQPLALWGVVTVVIVAVILIVGLALMLLFISS